MSCNEARFLVFPLPYYSLYMAERGLAPAAVRVVRTHQISAGLHDKIFLWAEENSRIKLECKVNSKRE